MTAAPALIDERVALWAAKLVAPTRSSDAGEVAALRAAVAADLPAIDSAARAWSGLGTELSPTRCGVVGRVGWVRTNLDALRGTFDPLGDRIRGSRVIASRVLGAQVGALLGLLSSKVLGQYVLPLGREARGRLVVVGPNLLDLADEHGDLADDIRRTVLLHEVTHRLQFEGIGWLAGHLRGLLTRYLDHAKLDPASVAEAASRLPEIVARVRETASIQPLVEAVLSEEQVAVVEEAQGLMSLLEGHGTAAMYEAVDGLIDDSAAVRSALQERRSDATTKVLQAVAGLEMKKRQYRVGEAFVRHVVEHGGITTLNRAFDRPENLPTHDEVEAPEQWIARVAAA